MATYNRAFDPQWTTETPLLVKFLDQLCNDMTQSERRQRLRSGVVQQKFNSAIKAIVLDLFRAFKSNPSLEVGIPLGTTHLQKQFSSRYGAPFLSARSFQDALNVLKETGLVELSTPHWDDPAKQNSRVARYKASKGLVSSLNDIGACAAFLHRRRGAEGIILKDKNKKKVEYGEILVADEHRKRLDVINSTLRAHWFDLSISDEEMHSLSAKHSSSAKDDASPLFDFSARTLHRVFNNNDWEQGGRFYGAWWMSIPSHLRQHILIDGKPTVEVDYSGLHAAMLYAEAGQKIPRDPYEKCYGKWRDKSARKVVKLTFNALLNASSSMKISPIDGFSEGQFGMSWQDFLKYVINCFPEFKQHFGSGVGLRLQFKDSELAEGVMLKFASMGYPCLPVHDSFIVHHAMHDELKKEMLDHFNKQFNTAIEAHSQLGYFDDDVTKNGGLVDYKIGELLDLSGHESRLNSFRSRLSVS